MGTTLRSGELPKRSDALASLLKSVAATRKGASNCSWQDVILGLLAPASAPLAEWLDDLGLSTTIVDSSPTDLLGTEPPPAGALPPYMIDYSAKARAGKLQPVFGRDAELREVATILSQARINNALLVGEPGVGKTAIVEALALALEENMHPALCGRRVVELDVGQLLSGTRYRGELEDRINKVLTLLASTARPVILFVDEIHLLVGAGKTDGGIDVANLLKPALARGVVRMVAATTKSEYRVHIERDGALSRRFQLVEVAEPDLESVELRRVVAGGDHHAGVAVKVEEREV